MTIDPHRQVYRSRTQSFGLIMCILVIDVIVGTGVARNINNTPLVAFGIGIIVLSTAVYWRAASTGIFTSPSGIHVRNVFSNSDFRWDEIERFVVDADRGWFPTICRIYTKDGRVKRAFGIQENNIALTKPMEQRPAAKIVAELNDLLATRTSDVHVS
jgi:hypothetical protein